MGAILIATSLPGSFVPNTGLRFADKAVHFTMYAGLGLLSARAMEDPPRTTRPRVLFAAALLCVAIGALDEWHQTFIQGRSTELADWIADSAGGLIGAATWTLRSRRKVIRTT